METAKIVDCRGWLLMSVTLFRSFSPVVQPFTKDQSHRTVAERSIWCRTVPFALAPSEHRQVGKLQNGFLATAVRRATISKEPYSIGQCTTHEHGSLPLPSEFISREILVMRTDVGH